MRYRWLAASTNDRHPLESKGLEDMTTEDGNTHHSLLLTHPFHPCHLNLECHPF
jgi:hypothetical protein